MVAALANVTILLSERTRTGREALQMQGAGLQAVNPTSFWQAHLKRFFWAHLALIIIFYHIRTMLICSNTWPVFDPQSVQPCLRSVWLWTC